MAADLVEALRALPPDARNGRRLAIVGDLLETYRLIHTRAAEAEHALRLALGPIRPHRHPDRRHRPR